jgi:hypothetical protein
MLGQEEYMHAHHVAYLDERLEGIGKDMLLVVASEGEL